MSLFCESEALKNESDVEQKFVWPLLTTESPMGMGYDPPDVYTKPNIRFLTIDKGDSQKVYRPDYVVILAGLPLLVIEAKAPGEPLPAALREARLYAAELNALHPAGVNPCSRIVATDGLRLLTSPTDSAAVDLSLELADIQLGSEAYHQLASLLGRAAAHNRAMELRARLQPPVFKRAANVLGGISIRDEEVGYNEFGVRLALDFLHVFNPRTRPERTHVVRHAYVPSKRRTHYADEIDRVIRSAAPAPAGQATLIDDASHPAALLRALGRGRDLQDRLFLLVGSVGAGKSTFVDYLRELKLTPELQKSLLWVNIDLNEAPVGKEPIQDWLVRRLIDALREAHPETDFELFTTLQKVFSVELRALKKGPLAALQADSEKYGEAVAEKLRQLLDSPVSHATSLARFLCAERGRLLVVVLDNCDKGDLEEQLTVFQIVRWLQSWLKCLVFLPIRDATYVTCRDKPPLDTVIKDFVFRIEAPPFAEVLRRRIDLALTELATLHKGELLEYTLESGIRVVYPATELGTYLACIHRSLYDHDLLLRRMLVGLAGSNMRKAMEIFLDFCKSGHIGQKEYLKIRALRGQYSLPYHVVTRVLLRANRRYYDGDKSHVKNLFQVDPGASAPSHLSRLAILRWLRRRFHDKGPSGIRGYHMVSRLIQDLIPFGYEAGQLRGDLDYLVQAMCITTEHQRIARVADGDLICLSAAGFAHLKLVTYLDYLAACSEDTWVTDEVMAARIAERIGQHGRWFHYSQETTRQNARDFASYLAGEAGKRLSEPARYLQIDGDDTAEEIKEICENANRRIENLEDETWRGLEAAIADARLCPGKVVGHRPFGLLVRMEGGARGLVHSSEMPDLPERDQPKVGDKVLVTVLAVDRAQRRVSLKYAGRG